MKLARALLGRAAACLRAGGEGVAVDAAVTPFVEAPTPAAYLAAVRALSAIARRGQSRRLDDALGAPTLAASVAALPPALAADADLLATLPATLASCARLHALARLLETHAALATRVRAGDARLGTPTLQPRAPYAAAKTPRAPSGRRTATSKRR